jgi:uncharacterized protein (DUF433 family)
VLDVPDLNIQLDKVKLVATAEVLHKPGVNKLTGYPHLVYAPAQYGPGVRTENNGTPVADIAAEISVNPDVDAVAAKFGVTVEHVHDALRYAAAAGFITEGEAK